MDIFTLKGITNELNKYAKNCIIKKVYHKNYELYFKLFGERNKRNLYINISPSSSKIFLTDKKFSFMETPSNFCMLLRKYLNNKKINYFNIPVFYRIVEIDFGDYKFLIKFTGKSSDYILCNNDYDIIYSFKNGKSLKKFVFPEVELINDFTEFKKKFPNIKGFPPFVLEEIKFINKNFGIKKAWNYYKDLINFNLNFSPYKINGKIYPFNLQHLSPLSKENFSEFNDLFDFEPEIKNRIKNFIKNKLKKLKNTIKKVEIELIEAKKYYYYEKLGELLKANLNKLPNGDYLTVWDYIENKEIKIPIDRKFSILDNMKRYFEKSKKLKRAKDKLIMRLYELKAELQYFEDILFYIEESNDVSFMKEIALQLGIVKQRSKDINIKSEPFKKILIKGIPVYIGKSAKGNDLILRNFAKPEYVWCHARGIPGAHVVICDKLENIDESILKKGCELAIKNSKAKNDGKGEVVYTKVKYLRKPKNAPPGLVIVTKENVLNIKFS